MNKNSVMFCCGGKVRKCAAITKEGDSFIIHDPDNPERGSFKLTKAEVHQMTAIKTMVNIRKLYING